MPEPVEKEDDGGWKRKATKDDGIGERYREQSVYPCVQGNFSGVP